MKDNDKNDLDLKRAAFIKHGLRSLSLTAYHDYKEEKLNFPKLADTMEAIVLTKDHLPDKGHLQL